MRSEGPSAPKGSGQALVEMVFMIPLMMVIIVNVVNFGGYFYAGITVANAARAAGQYFVLGPVTVNSPQIPSAAQVLARAVDDTALLLNPASFELRMCTTQGGLLVCDPDPSPCALPDPPADTRPEGALYPVAWVDVCYTYEPYVPLLSFPALGLHLTLPTSSIRRQAVMRVLQ